MLREHATTCLQITNCADGFALLKEFCLINIGKCHPSFLVYPCSMTSHLLAKYETEHLIYDIIYSLLPKRFWKSHGRATKTVNQFVLCVFPFLSTDVDKMSNSEVRVPETYRFIDGKCNVLCVQQQETAERPKLLSQLRAKSIAAGSSFMGQINKLNPLGQGTPEQSGKLEDVDVPVEEEDEEDPNMSTVRLSDEAASSKAKPGFLDQLKQTSDTAGAAIVGGLKATSDTAGAAIVGGFKATTTLLAPLVGGGGGGAAADKAPKDDRNDEQISDEFAHIQIDDEPEPAKPKLSMLEQMKLKTGLAKPKEEEATPTHHQERPTSHHSEPPKEGFLEQMKAKIGLTKEDDGIAHNSAPKEGLLSKVNPFASSSPVHKESPAPVPASKGPNRFSHHREESRRSSTTASSSGGITSVFESITGKTSPPKKRPEPAKQASFMDHITGKPAAPAKEPSFFDKMTGNTQPAAKSTDTGWF